MGDTKRVRKKGFGGKSEKDIGIGLLEPFAPGVQVEGKSLTHGKEKQRAFDILDLKGSRKEATAARRQKVVEGKVKDQQKAEALRLAEETSAVEERKQLGKKGRGGRSLLIGTSPTGTRVTNLGGTA